MPTAASVPTAVLSLVISLALPLLSYVEHIYSARPSSILNIFLLFTTLFDAARARTLWLQPYHGTIAIIAVSSVSVKIVSLALEATEKRKHLRSAYETLPPEDTSGILSRWLFAWQIRLFRAGYKTTLGIDDLYSLDKHLKSPYLHQLLQRRWSRGETDIISILRFFVHVADLLQGCRSQTSQSTPSCSLSVHRSRARSFPSYFLASALSRSLLPSHSSSPLRSTGLNETRIQRTGIKDMV